mgnify:CR=1 FL=1
MKRPGQRKTHGFTIVELLIVIVVIAIIAAITVVAYSGIQSRARDAPRKQDITSLIKAFEVYYSQNGTFPVTSGSTSINGSWVTTADASWSNLEAILVPQYISKLPRDPISKQMTAGNFPWNDADGYDYSIFTANTSGYCGVGVRQAYLIVYKTENGTQVNQLDDCSTGTSLAPRASSSNNRVVRY